MARKTPVWVIGRILRQAIGVARCEVVGRVPVVHQCAWLITDLNDCAIVVDSHLKFVDVYAKVIVLGRAVDDEDRVRAVGEPSG